MEQGLAQLSAIPHVGGAFICDNRGEVIVSSSPAVLATVTMNAIGREVGRVLAALETAGRHATRLDFTYTSWRLLAVDMENALLFLVCHSPVDMSMVRMTTDVVLTGWRTDPAVQKRLQQHRVERRELVNRISTERGNHQQAGWQPIKANGH